MKLNNFFENINTKSNSGVEKLNESGCLGKQIKKGKKKVKEDQSYDDLRVAKYLCYNDNKKFKPYGTQMEYIKKAEDMREENPDKYQSILRQPSPPSDDSWRSKLNNSVQEEIDLTDNMLGTPDSFYDEEERKEAYLDLKDAMEEFSKGWERESVMNGICPNCAGTGYQDGEYPEYDDDGEEIEDSAYECDGYGSYGCDEGEMVGASWVDIVKHDERQAERQKAKDNYPGDEAVIDQIARAVKQMDDPRQMYQYMKADYPFMGMAQRSSLIAQGMKKAGLTSESITEGEERSIIADACVEKLVDEFGGREHQFQNKDDLEYAIYNELESLDVADCVDPEMEVGGQPIGDFASGRVIDCCSSSDIIYDVMANMDETQIGEGRIEDTFGTDTVDKHDKPKKKKKDNKEIEEDKALDGNEAMVSKMLAKALGDENRWSEMTPHELYAELESEKPEVADVIKLTAKMLYDVRLAENTKDNCTACDKDMADCKCELCKDCDAKGCERCDDGKIVTETQDEHDRIMDEIMQHADNSAIKGKHLVKYIGKKITLWTEGHSNPPLQRTYKIDKGPEGGISIDGSEYGPEDFVNHNSADDYSWKSEQAADIYSDLIDKQRDMYEEITLDEDQDFTEEFGILGYSIDEENTFEAEYQGRKVKLNKPMRGDVKKFKVYVKDPKTGNVKKVNFGHGGTSAKRKTMRIRKSNPKARKSFRARHNCDNPGPKTKARYWSCRKW